jgi:ATP-binding cassette, subfamily B, multidrug efflux pump
LAPQARRRGGMGGPGGFPRENLPKNKGLQRSIAYLGHYRNLAIVAYIALIVATLSQLAVPQLIQGIFEQIFRGYGAQTQLANPLVANFLSAEQKTALNVTINDAERALITAAIVIVVFAITRGIFAFIQTYASERTSQGIAFDFRNQIFAKVQRLSFSYHDQNQTGQLMIRATDDVEKLRLFLGQGLLLAVQALILVVGAFGLLFATNARLTLVVLPILPVALVLFFIFGGVSASLFGKVQMYLSKMNTLLQENLAGIKVVKAFAKENYEQKRFEQSTAELMEQQLKVSRAFSILFPFVFLIAQIGQVAILYFGGRQIISNELTLAEYQKFSLYLIYIFFPIGQLGFIIQLMAQAAASASRIYEILDAKNEVSDKPNAIDLPQVQGNIEFKDVTFKYFGSTAPVLSEISFTATPGQTVALLGATGSGKTTIINLLPRFYDPSSGQILIDGHDVRDVKIDSLRGQIGIVLQETTLFSGTIRDNIAFGRPEASMDEVIEAAQAAAAHDFITGFPQGYDTPVGERGATLSGGQKQRIAIARALLLNPRILILDDSTSSVDLATEYKIQKALDRLMEGRTSFVIAQRISTVVNADMILVLEKGKIVAQGKHEELMEESAIYADIYHSQLVGDAQDAPEAAQAAAQPLTQGA